MELLLSHLLNVRYYHWPAACVIEQLSTCFVFQNRKSCPQWPLYSPLLYKGKCCLHLEHVLTNHCTSPYYVMNNAVNFISQRKSPNFPNIIWYFIFIIFLFTILLSFPLYFLFLLTTSLIFVFQCSKTGHASLKKFPSLDAFFSLVNHTAWGHKFHWFFSLLQLIGYNPVLAMVWHVTPLVQEKYYSCLI